MYRERDRSACNEGADFSLLEVAPPTFACNSPPGGGQTSGAPTRPPPLSSPSVPTYFCLLCGLAPSACLSLTIIMIIIMIIIIIIIMIVVVLVLIIFMLF